MRKLFWAVILTAVLNPAPPVALAVDLNGKWHFELLGAPLLSQIVQITQTGSAVTIPYGFTFTGTVGATDPAGFTPYSASFTDGSMFVSIGGRITPSANLLDGIIGGFIPPGPPQGAGIIAMRCTCDDGNTMNGDGCDGTCQVEPCWTCTGEPSICAPTSDGGACEDGSICTTGETCTAGVCGGGSPVAPCFDMTGPWTRHRAIPDLGVASDTMTTVIQRGTDLRIGNHVGTINPATGAFDIRVADPIPFCGGFDPLVGALAPDGLTYSATGTVLEPKPFAPDTCDQFNLTETGDHCGDGTFDGAEQCDDGNLGNGDGCSAQCQVEPCWMCSGTPSVCAPVAGGPCDDSNPCTISDTCAGDGSCAGTPDSGAPCDDDSACTTADECAGDGSCGGTPVDCGQCAACDIALGCVIQPGAPCDDSDPCTTGEVCEGDGTCGGSPQTCEPCFACDAVLGCVVEPQAVCKASTVPEKSIVYLKNAADDAKDRFSWRWKKGDTTLLSELGNPPGGDDISVCVYDESTATTALLFRATIPGSSLWTSNATGFRYKEPTASADGMSVGLLKSGVAGKASAKVKGKGVHLSDRPHGLPGVPVPLPLRVQLQGENGLCLKLEYDTSGVIKNDAAQGIFKARGTP